MNLNPNIPGLNPNTLVPNSFSPNGSVPTVMACARNVVRGVPQVDRILQRRVVYPSPTPEEEVSQQQAADEAQGGEGRGDVNPPINPPWIVALYSGPSIVCLLCVY